MKQEAKSLISRIEVINRGLESKRAALKNHTSTAKTIKDSIDIVLLDRMRLTDQLFTFLSNDGATRVEESDDSDR